MQPWIAVAALAALGARAETLDRITVTVGAQVVTESQMLLALRSTALLSREPVDLSAPAKRKMAEWLADQILIVQEAAANHITLPSSEAAKGKLESVKALYPSEEQYKRDLERYSIQENDLAEILLADLREQTFVDLRFRPEIQLSDDDLRAYYGTLFAGRSFDVCRADENCRADVEKKLLDQRALDLLDKWLVTARAGSRIQYREKVFQ
jgi:hypothetical protein